MGRGKEGWKHILILLNICELEKTDAGERASAINHSQAVTLERETELCQLTQNITESRMLVRSNVFTEQKERHHGNGLLPLLRPIHPPPLKPQPNQQGLKAATF
ncbi:hypothetical protein JZ751_027920 [Albula glossodonta]|uniref:Uncharacterized protein n=1 Tax=Albula glossodonta TaxID=121402 RepID=A0A8T2PAA7_9TELE|nr:hypothetical protein JZ751_027920 [Albula glossodonta]